MSGLPPKIGTTFEIKVAAYLLSSVYDFGSLQLDLRNPIDFDIYLSPYPAEYTSFGIEVDLDIYFMSKSGVIFLFECKSSKRPTISPKSDDFINALSKFYALRKYQDAEKKRNVLIHFVFATNMYPREIINFIKNPTKDIVEPIKSKLIKELQKRGAPLKSYYINLEELINFIRSILVIYLPEKTFGTMDKNIEFAENIKRVLDKLRSKKKPSTIQGIIPQISMEDMFDIYFGTIKHLQEKDLKNIKVKQSMDVHIGYDISLEDKIDTIRQKIKPDIDCIELSLKEFDLNVHLVNKELDAINAYKPLANLINNLLLDYRVFIYADLENFVLYNPKKVAEIVSASRIYARGDFDLNKIRNTVNTKLNNNVLIEIAIDSYVVEKGHKLSPKKFKTSE